MDAPGRGAVVRTNAALRRLERATREARQALREIERADVGEVLGRFTVKPGDAADADELVEFVRLTVAEADQDLGLEVTVKTVETGPIFRAPAGAEGSTTNGTHGQARIRR